MNLNLLNDFGLKYQTDKSTMHHCYLPFYELIFQKFLIPVNLLEIGIQFGCSLRTWRDYFGQQSTIVGIDSVDNHIGDVAPTLLIHGDAYTPEMVNELEKRCKESADYRFHIIIDDGSHLVEHQRFVVANYHRLLADYGILIIEDVPGTEVIPRLVEVLPAGFDHATVDLRTAEVGTHDSILFLMWRK